MRYFLSVLCAVAVLQTTAKLVHAQETEIKPSAAIAQVVAADLMTNYPDGQFYPQRMISRAELAKIMVKTFGLDRRQGADKQNVEVTDVPKSHWAYNDIQTVLNTGIMKGYRGNLFFPNQRVTKAEALAIFAQAYGVFQFPQATVDEILAGYTDASTIPDWSKRAIATVVTEGFIDSEQTQLSPLQPMTRQDMAEILSKYLQRQQQRPQMPEVPGGSVNPNP